MPAPPLVVPPELPAIHAKLKPQLGPHILTGPVAVKGAKPGQVLQVDIEPGPIRPGAGSVLLGLYVLAWGFMFLASYFFSHKTFFFRGLIWVCEHLSFPASRKMAFFYFVLTLFIGGLTVLKGLALL